MNPLIYAAAAGLASWLLMEAAVTTDGPWTHFAHDGEPCVHCGQHHDERWCPHQEPLRTTAVAS